MVNDDIKELIALFILCLVAISAYAIPGYNKTKYCGKEATGHKFYGENKVDCWKIECYNVFTEEKGANNVCKEKHWNVEK